MDELAYSLNGENVHYGTPRNPACPDRIPGGSSSGSAVSELLHNPDCHPLTDSTRRQLPMPHLPEAIT